MLPEPPRIRGGNRPNVHFWATGREYRQGRHNNRHPRQHDGAKRSACQGGRKKYGADKYAGRHAAGRDAAAEGTVREAVRDGGAGSTLQRQDGGEPRPEPGHGLCAGQPPVPRCTAIPVQGGVLAGAGRGRDRPARRADPGPVQRRGLDGARCMRSRKGECRDRADASGGGHHGDGAGAGTGRAPHTWKPEARRCWRAWPTAQHRERPSRRLSSRRMRTQRTHEPSWNGHERGSRKNPIRP